MGTQATFATWTCPAFRKFSTIWNSGNVIFTCSLIDIWYWDFIDPTISLSHKCHWNLLQPNATLVPLSMDCLLVSILDLNSKSVQAKGYTRQLSVTLVSIDSSTSVFPQKITKKPVISSFYFCCVNYLEFRIENLGVWKLTMNRLTCKIIHAAALSIQRNMVCFDLCWNKDMFILTI